MKQGKCVHEMHVSTLFYAVRLKKSKKTYNDTAVYVATVKSVKLLECFVVRHKLLIPGIGSPNAFNVSTSF